MWRKCRLWIPNIYWTGTRFKNWRADKGSGKTRILSVAYLYTTWLQSIFFKELSDKWHMRKFYQYFQRHNKSVSSYFEIESKCLKLQQRAQCWKLLKQKSLVLATVVALKMQMFLCPSPKYMWMQEATLGNPWHFCQYAICMVTSWRFMILERGGLGFWCLGS